MKTWNELMDDRVPLTEEECLIVQLVVALTNEKARYLTVAECGELSRRVFRDAVEASTLLRTREERKRSAAFQLFVLRGKA